ncbi:MAG: hypothetical protein ACYDCC_03865 [Actinomycetota bacterium]
MIRRLFAVVAAVGIIAAFCIGGPVGFSYARPSLDSLLMPSGPGHHPETMTEGEKAAQFLSDREGQVDPARAVAARFEAARQAGFISVSAGSGGWRQLDPHGYRGDDTTYNDPYNGAPPTGFTHISGRVSAIAVDPNDPSGNTVWVGTGGGGLWVTHNGGAWFRPVWDSKISSAIGAIAFDQAKTKMLYVGTGDGSAGSYASAGGDGVYRSTNDGRSFTRVARNVNAALVTKIAARSGRVYVGTNRGLWISTDAGSSYRYAPLNTNADGTAPGTALLSNMISDVVISPDAWNEVTAAVGCVRGQAAGCMGNGLYRSGDGGVTWNRIDSSGLATGSLSDDSIGRISLSYASGPGENHQVLWAVVQDPGMANGTMKQGVPRHIPTQLNGIYRSADDGVTWTLKGNFASLVSAPGSGLLGQAALYTPGIQASYNQWIAVSPVNPSIVVVGLEEVYQTDQNADSSTGLATWTTIGRYWDMCAYPVNYSCDPTNANAGPYAGQVTTHGDQHAFAFGSGGTRLWVGNDGGVMRQDSSSGIFSNTGWREMNDSLGTTQAYYSAMGTDGTVYAGFQDNGIGKITPNGEAVDTFVGDGGDVAVDPANSNNAWGEYVFGAMFTTADGGKDWTDVAPDLPNGAQFIAPFAMDPTDANHVVLGASSIVETTKGVGTVCTQDFLVTGTHLPNDAHCDWINSYDLGVDSQGAQRTATAIADQGPYVYAGFCGVCGINIRDANSDRQIRNGIATNFRPGCTPAIGTNSCWHIASAKGLPNRYITGIAMLGPSGIVATESGYSQSWIAPTSRTPNIGRGHVFFSYDGGEHFIDISRNLPNTPVRSIVASESAGKLFIGTDMGVYTLGATGWQRYGRGLPNVAVDDLKTNPQETMLVAATYGRGIWSIPIHRIIPTFRTRIDRSATKTVSVSNPIIDTINKMQPAAIVHSNDSKPASSWPVGVAIGLVVSMMAAIALRSRRAFR